MNALIPRTFKSVDETGFGDCKDYASLMTVIFRKLGYKADVALVNLTDFVSFKAKMPMASAWNHAMVRIEDDNRQVWWVDPTNMLGNPMVPRPYFSGRDVLILDSENPRIEHIVEMSPTSNTRRSKDVIEVLANGVSVRKFDQEFSPVYTARYFDFYIEKNTTNFIDDHTRDMIHVEEEGQWLQKPSLASYVPNHGIRLQGKLRYRLVDRKTSAGTRFQVPAVYADLWSHQADYVAGYDLGAPGATEDETELFGAKVVGRLPQPCTIESPWVKFHRQYKIQKKKVFIIEKYENRRRYISPEEFQSPTFKAFAEKLRDCASEFVIIYRPIGRG